MALGRRDFAHAKNEVVPARGRRSFIASSYVFFFHVDHERQIEMTTLANQMCSNSKVQPKRLV
jgi:hypothetical protein